MTTATAPRLVRDSDFERTPPHDIRAEQCVLGGMMLSPAAIDDVTDVMRIRDHYRPAHQIVHEAIMRLRDSGQPVDAVTVASELVRTGEISRAGGHDYIHTLIAAVPTAANAGYYARAVRELSVLRGLIEAGTRIAQMGYSHDSGGSEALADLARAELDTAIGDMPGTDELPTAGEMFDDFVSRMASPKEDAALVWLPWEDMRTHVPYLRPGQLITIGARPNTGKSFFASDLIRHVGLRQGHPVILFSLEMKREEVIDRMAAAEAVVNLSEVQAAKVSDPSWDRFMKIRERFQEARFVIEDRSRISLGQIRARLRKMARVNPARLVVIDYLQLMGTDDRAQNREREISQLTAGLKALAGEFSVPIVLLAQLNRGPEQRMDKVPVMSDLRESGAIENDSDVVVLIHRPDMHDAESPRAGEADFIIDKNRAGTRGVTVTVGFQGHYGRFVNLQWSPSHHAAA